MVGAGPKGPLGKNRKVAICPVYTSKIVINVVTESATIFHIYIKITMFKRFWEVRTFGNTKFLGFLKKMNYFKVSI